MAAQFCSTSQFDGTGTQCRGFIAKLALPMLVRIHAHHTAGGVAKESFGCAHLTIAISTDGDHRGDRVTKGIVVIGKPFSQYHMLFAGLEVRAN